MKKYRPEIGEKFRVIHRETGRPAKDWPMKCLTSHPAYVSARDAKGNLREFDNHAWSYEKLNGNSKKST